jgi:antitoxin component YwqK of YwqJK toxin-antitoxin module
MNRTQLLPLLSFLILPLCAHAVQDCTLNGEHVNPANGNTTAGKTGLMRCIDRDSKEVMREQELQGGKFMGVVRHFKDGKMEREHAVNEKGNMHGRAREFAPGGQVVRDATYENGSTVGLSRSYYPDGKPRRAAFHEQGGGELASVEFTEAGLLSSLRCGDRPLLAPAADDARLCGFSGAVAPVEFFSSRGILRARTTYAGGKRVRSESFYDNGKTSQLDETTGAQQTVVRFTPEGLKRAELVYSIGERGPVRTAQRDYSDRGTLAREQRWSAGEATTDDTYYLNGQPKTKTVFSREGNRASRVVKDFHDNGQLAGDGVYSGMGYRSVPVGVHRQFNERGVLVSESSYDERGRLNRSKSWDESGRLLRDEEVFEDGSRKAFAR